MDIVIVDNFKNIDNGNITYLYGLQNFTANSRENDSAYENQTVSGSSYRVNFVFNLATEYSFNVIFGLMAMFTVVANLITVLVIRRTPHLKKMVFNMFLTSLCVSDIFSAMVSPMIVYRKISGYYNFVLPGFICNLALSIEYWTSCVTMQHVLVMCWFRLYGLMFPHKIKKITRLHAKITIVIIWFMMGLISILPYSIFTTKEIREGPNGKDTSTCLMRKQWFYIIKAIRLYTYPIIWYIPIILVIIMSIVLFFLLLQRRANGPAPINSDKAKEIKAIIQLVAINGSFFFGYLPDLGFRLYIVSLRGKYGNIWMPYNAWLYSVMSHFMLRMSECLNPILYNMSSSQIWAATQVFLQDYRCLKKPNAKDSSKKKEKGRSQHGLKSVISTTNSKTTEPEKKNTNLTSVTTVSESKSKV